MFAHMKCHCIRVYVHTLNYLLSIGPDWSCGASRLVMCVIQSAWALRLVSQACAHIWQPGKWSDQSFFQENLYNGENLGMHVISLVMPCFTHSRWAAHVLKLGVKCLAQGHVHKCSVRGWRRGSLLTSPSWQDFPRWSGIWNNRWSQGKTAWRGIKYQF